MAFGLRNAPGLFEKLMTSILAGYIEKFCKVYLDDVIVFNNTLKEHEEHLQFWNGSEPIGSGIISLNAPSPRLFGISDYVGDEQAPAKAY